MNASIGQPPRPFRQDTGVDFTQHLAKRRAYFTKHVKRVVAVCGVICLVALVRVGISSASSDGGAAPASNVLVMSKAFRAGPMERLAAEVRVSPPIVTKLAEAAPAAQPAAAAAKATAAPGAARKSGAKPKRTR